MAHGWRERHQAQAESQDWVTSRLRQTVGAPTPEGERRPFMRGSYRARAELTDVTPAAVSEPVLVGSGSATLKVMGAYRGDETQEYLLEVQNGGEVGSATCRWSLNGGQSWQDSGFQTGGGDAPVQLQAGLAVYWDSGPGTDLVAGDRWTFTATPPIYRCRVYGAPFVAITAVYLSEAQTWEGVAADPATGVILVTGRSDQVEARVTKDATTHPVDIMADILAEVGLSQAINQDSFALAKSLTPEYAIGVCFENISAAQALREIVRRCLYDLWVDFGEIKIRAYLGEDSNAGPDIPHYSGNIMGRIDWARAAQFNWAFDNMGGTPLQEAVAGNWQGATALVEDDGRITLTAPNPGGGQVYFIRGIYPVDTVFPWNGFWADPMSGDLTNYYQGGSFSNQGEATIITLGTPLAAGTPVQLYYIYLTGKQAARYEPLNNYPCIRRASRSRDDYTYDFAVDRLLDLMACLHFAGPAQGQDYTPLIRFLWEAFIGREQSRTSPLLRDSFERQFWDRGEHLMYRGASPGVDAFQVFQSEAAAGGPGRVLHARVLLPASTDAAWFGYGLDWSLEAAPFNGVDRLSFKLQGPAGTLRVHNLTKIGSGSATLILRGDYARQEKRRFVVYIQSTGAVGAATFQLVQGRRPDLGGRRPDQRRPAAPGGPVGRP